MNTDKPPVLSDAQHAASLLEDSALFRAVTPPPVPTPLPVLQSVAEVRTLARDSQIYSPIIAISVVICSFAFLAGFLVHRAVQSPIHNKTPDATVAAKDAELFTLTGRLAWYDTAEQRVRDDSDAMIILLPEDKTPSVFLSTRGVRNKSQQEEFATQISELGGGFATTNSEGIFTVAVKPGSYILLALSSQPRSTTEPIPMSIIDNLKRYFVSPDDGLIGTSRYHCVRQFAVPASPVLHVF